MGQQHSYLVNLEGMDTNAVLLNLAGGKDPSLVTTMTGGNFAINSNKTANVDIANDGNAKVNVNQAKGGNGPSLVTSMTGGNIAVNGNAKTNFKIKNKGASINANQHKLLALNLLL